MNSFFIWGIILIGLLFFTSVTFRLLGVKWFSRSFPAAHLLFIAVAACGYFSAPRVDSLDGAWWLVPAAFDLPISLVLVRFPGLIVPEWRFASSLAVLGTLQYYVIGLCLDVFIVSRKSRGGRKERCQQTPGT
jgi:hypothetical protein